MLRSRVQTPGRASTIGNMPDVARASCAHSRPKAIRDQCQLEAGWARLARAMRLAPSMSGDSSRSNARGRSDLHSPNDARTSQAHVSPGTLQDRRGTKTASSPFRQSGVSRLAATDFSSAFSCGCSSSQREVSKQAMQACTSVGFGGGYVCVCARACVRLTVRPELARGLV